MEMSINESIKKIQISRLTDFIAFAAILYSKNFGFIFTKIILVQLISISILYLIFISLDGEFNLTFFLLPDGNIFLVILTIAILVNSYNSIYQCIKLIVFQKLELRLICFKLKLFVLSSIRFILFVLILVSVFFDINFILMSLVFLILSVYFYYYLFIESNEKILGEKSCIPFFDFYKKQILSAFILILNRVMIIGIPLIVTFSIYIIYEFMRFLVVGEIFFFIEDRLIGFSILGSFMFLIFLILNPFQYFTMLLFYKYFMSKFFRNLED